MRVSPRGAVALLLVPIIVSAGFAASRLARRSASTPNGLVDELSRLRLPRTVAPRLSVATEYRPCRLTPPAEGTVAVTTCPRTPPRAEAASLSARAATAARARAEAGALQAAAAVDLLWSDGRVPVDRAIGHLQAASRLSPRPASVLADLAAAHLLRAERAQSPRDLLEAVEAADRALETDSGQLSARWNLALALDRLGVDGEALQAWSEYLSRDSASGWAGEASERIRAIRRSHAAPPRPDTSVAALEGYGERAPQEAGWMGWVDELGAWGAAIQRGDTAGAAPHLRRAEALGRGIAHRPGGDAGLSDAVAALRAHAADPAALRALAAAHADYAEGRRIYLRGDYPQARERLARAARAARASSVLWQSASLFHAATLVYARQPAGEMVMRTIASTADTLRYPTLAGRARWMLGTTLVRRGRPEDGLSEYAIADRFFGRAGESENSGVLSVVQGSVSFDLGDLQAGAERMHRAFLSLPSKPGDPWRHIQFQLSANAAAAAGLTHAAIRLQRESLAAARETGSSIYLAEAVLGMANLLATAGRTAAAERETAAGRSMVRMLPAGDVQMWFESDLRTAEARLLALRNPRLAAAKLDSVLVSPTVAGFPQRELLARIARADARLRIGATDSAAADLDRVIAILDKERTSIKTATLRASLVDAARPVFDRMVMFRVQAGDAEGALRYLERGREAFAPVPSVPHFTTQRLQARPGETALEYALIGDTLLTWTVRDTTVRLVRAVVSRERFLEYAQHVRSLLEAQADDSAANADLVVLYDWLIRPVQPALGAAESRVAIVADGEIAAIPFGALWDRRQRRYLIANYTIRFASTLFQGSRNPGVPTRTALVVSNPLLDSRRSAFPPLPGAAAEATAVASSYPHAEVLSGGGATAGALRAALPRSTLFHFAGHAVFDNERPERSFLVVAPGGSGRDLMSAAEIEQLDLRGLRLAVLSACETLPTQQRRSGGFTGLPAAFLAAGAAGVVGSLWRVDDRLTRPLMTEFHTAYRTTGDGAASLRAAQLTLIRSPDPTLRSPSAWAAFRYAGF